MLMAASETEYSDAISVDAVLLTLLHAFPVSRSLLVSPGDHLASPPFFPVQSSMCRAIDTLATTAAFHCRMIHTAFTHSVCVCLGHAHRDVREQQLILSAIHMFDRFHSLILLLSTGLVRVKETA